MRSLCGGGSSVRGHQVHIHHVIHAIRSLQCVCGVSAMCSVRSYHCHILGFVVHVSNSLQSCMNSERTVKPVAQKPHGMHTKACCMCVAYTA